MSYGLKVLNSGNSLLIDDTYRVFRVIKTGTVTAKTEQIENGWWASIIRLPVEARTKPIAIRCTTSTSQYSNVIEYSPTWISDPFLQGVGTIDYVVLDFGSTSLASNYGMIVKNSSGAIVFNSNDDMFLVKQVCTTSFYSEGTVGNFTIPTGGYTLLQTVSQATLIRSGPYDYGGWIYTSNPNSSTVKFRFQVAFDGWGNQLRYSLAKLPSPTNLNAAIGIRI